ncbi:MAG: PhoU domain-containing protein [Pseudomonadota bacterium]
MNDHIVTAFTDELEQLSADLLRMGGLSEAMIMDACSATLLGDLVAAAAVIERDREVDELEAGVEQRIMRSSRAGNPWRVTCGRCWPP